MIKACSPGAIPNLLQLPPDPSPTPTITPIPSETPPPTSGSSPTPTTTPTPSPTPTLSPTPTPDWVRYRGELNRRAGSEWVDTETIMYRFFLNDAIPFHRQLVFASELAFDLTPTPASVPPPPPSPPLVPGRRGQSVENARAGLTTIARLVVIAYVKPPKVFLPVVMRGVVVTGTLELPPERPGEGYPPPERPGQPPKEGYPPPLLGVRPPATPAAGASWRGWLAVAGWVVLAGWTAWSGRRQLLSRRRPGSPHGSTIAPPGG